jgi:hypothetical protein
MSSPAAWDIEQDGLLAGECGAIVGRDALAVGCAGDRRGFGLEYKGVAYRHDLQPIQKKLKPFRLVS